MSDISLLPQDFKDKEEELKKINESDQKSDESSTMHIPTDDADDVEIIEVEEGEVDQVLNNEPAISRLIYKTGMWLESAKNKLFKSQKPELPAKTPPQFFRANANKPGTRTMSAGVPGNTSPSPGLAIGAVPPTGAAPALGVPTPANTLSGQTLSQPKARIVPSAASPRRVKIIKRVKKPVQVSLLDSDVMRQLHINVPKRKFTLGFLTLFFMAVFSAAYLLLDQQQAKALSLQNQYDNEKGELRVKTDELQKKWSEFRGLEPKLLALSDLMDKHISMLQALKFLEQRTLSQISYSNSFSMDSAGQVTLSVTAPSYEAAARQLVVFKEAPELKSAEASAFSQTIDTKTGEKSVSFSVTIQFQNTALLFEKPTSIR